MLFKWFVLSAIISIAVPHVCGLQLNSGLQDELAAALGVSAAQLAHSTDTWHSKFTVDRQILGSGFHRTVSYNVQYTALVAQELRECKLALLQYLPSSLYADPYQLEDISRAATGPAAAPTSSAFAFQLLGPVDLELPAPACQPTALLVHFNLSLQQPESPAALLSIPLHAKYPEPVSFDYQGWHALATGQVGMVLPEPSLLVDCRSRHGDLHVLHASSSSAQNRQQQSDDTDDTKGDAAVGERKEGVQEQEQQLLWEVPAGNLDHLRMVSWATLLVTATCCVLLCVRAVQVTLGS